MKDTNNENTKFLGKFHKLSERAEWGELTRLLIQVRNSTDSRSHELLKKHLTTGEGFNSWTPLMLACARAAPSDVVRLLIETCPESVLIADRSGGLPIHFICSWRRSLEGDEDSFNLVADEDFLLLELLKIFVHANPETLRRQNQWGQTPLHCMFNQKQIPSIGAFQSLLGIAILDQDENTPHGKVDWESADGLDQGFNSIQSHVLKALATPDYNSHLPLHLAAQRGAAEDILCLLVSLYPDAALEATPSGDLPVHLLQYWAEEKIEEEQDDGSFIAGNNEKMRPPLFHFGGSGRLGKNKLFQIVTVGQIQTLLEPMCSSFSPALQFSFHEIEIETMLGTNAHMTPISERDEEATTENSNSVRGSIDGAKSLHQSISPDLTTQTNNAVQPQQSIVDRAIRLAGSKYFKLPIHIAAEHGVSMQVISDLCDQYPEGAGTAQRTPKYHVSSGGGERLEGMKMIEIFPIELFEKGRAGIESEKATQIQKRHVANPRNIALTNTTLNSTEINLSEIDEEIKNFEERSDLLFAYYPEATPSSHKENTMFGSKDSLRARRRTPYRREGKRLHRIESLIKSEAIGANTLDFNMTAKLIWIWLIKKVNLENDSEKGIYQACIGRIVTGLPGAALQKLSFIAKNGRKVHPRLTNQIGFETSPCSINGKSIEEFAKDRKTSTTMEEMIEQKDELSRWQFTTREYLGHHDGLSFSLSSKKALTIGLCLLPDVPLPETGSTWNFQEMDNTINQDQTKFWQHIDFGLILPRCTHSVVISYYLEVSEAKGQAFERDQRQNSQRSFGNGGLMVVSDSRTGKHANILSFAEDFMKDELSWDLVASQQKKAHYSLISTPHGCEVLLSFKYDPTKSYSLRVWGPDHGGRVSVSNAKIRQVCYVLILSSLSHTFA